MANQLACLREENFVDSTKYKPDRWLSDNNIHHPMATIPFGYGRQACLAKSLAEMQLAVGVAKVSVQHHCSSDGYNGFKEYFFSFLYVTDCTEVFS